MIYLVAVFIPPLYFLTKKKWLPFIVSSCLLILSLFFAMTVILIPVSLILWGLCSAVAAWNVKKSLMHEHADLIATKMAEKFRQG